MSKRLLLCFLLACLVAADVSAESRRSNAPEFRVCTQNLNRAESRPPGARRGKSGGNEKVDELIIRFREARCDVIALQEVVGADKDTALQNLERIAERLNRASGESYRAYVGDSHDNYIRNGFLVKLGAVEVTELKSHSLYRLPKLQPRASSHHFSRGPLELRLIVRGVDGAPSREAAVIAVHFKSKARAWKDPTATEFEAMRMEMAEAVRELANESRKELPSTGLVVIAGDFNTRDDSAAMEVLSGARELNDFRQPNKCAVSKSLGAECSSTAGLHTSSIQPAFSYDSDLAGIRVGSYRYKKQLELIDNILVFKDQLWMLRRGGDFVGGATGTFRKGSDHKLLWVEINW
ncbi:MAG: endonuclease/exonuclease/phosphatase family protein [Bdellovibrionales bacterium]|nr:endonuclease/exonuclease/phosphatase family protein [Bdellovibrionales bacterium]